MKTKRNLIVGLAATALLGIWGLVSWQQGPGASVAQGSHNTLAQTVRAATTQFKNIDAAKRAGYEQFYGCVSSQDGTMGTHYVNGGLVGDGAVDANRPEALMYESDNGTLRLIGVEYVVLAADWDRSNTSPPVLNGQLFDYSGSPNRYKIPAFYSLHVWAWKQNPAGTFAGMNPRVSCDDFTG